MELILMQSIQSAYGTQLSSVLAVVVQLITMLFAVLVDLMFQRGPETSVPSAEEIQPSCLSASFK